ncbi:MAG: ClbS/DfsB family four-helix bundle protein [Blautia faecis]
MKSDERKGLHVKTPSDNFRWNQLGGLYQWFTDTYAHLSLQELKAMLNENINMIYEMIDSLSDERVIRATYEKSGPMKQTQNSGMGSIQVYTCQHFDAPFGNI